tara:strand:+ start:8829 stop:9908 length:1080 start_codon:yes stop_codon:yes gene_type:complete
MNKKNLIRDLSYISKLYGSMPEIVQSGGGNVSVKSNGIMLIKSSGIHLSDVSSSKHLAKINLNGLLSTFKNKITDSAFQKRIERKIIKNTLNSKVPSIETSMHIFLNDYVLHTHPTSVLSIVSNKNAQSTIGKLFKDVHHLIIKYKNPGTLLAQEIYKKIESYKKSNRAVPKIIFLLNHGVIVHSDDLNEIIVLQETIIDRTNEFLKIKDDGRLNQLTLFGLINSQLTNEDINIVYKSILKLSDYIKNKTIIKKNERASFFPDKVVYCDDRIFVINKKEDMIQLIDNYLENKSFPRIIIIKDWIYILARNLSKAREIEDVFRVHLEILQRNPEKSLVKLTTKESNFLKYWDAEEYRKKI